MRLDRAQEAENQIRWEVQVIVTHDPEEALTLSDKVLVINEGRIAQFASPVEIMANPADDFIRRFILSQLTIKRDNIFRLFGTSHRTTPALNQAPALRTEAM